MRHETKYGTVEIRLGEETVDVVSNIPFYKVNESFKMDKLSEAKKKFNEIVSTVDQIISEMESKKSEVLLDDLPLSKEVDNLIKLGFRKILLYGGTGTGKTHTLLEICKKLKNKGVINDYLLFTCSSGMEDIDFIGKLLPSLEKSKSIKFVPSEFTKYLERARYEKIAIIIDEFNRVHSKALNFLIPLLDEKDGNVRLNNFITGDIIEIPAKNIWFFFTANFGGGFSGVYKLDDALLNRVDVALHVDYQDKLEKNFLDELEGWQKEFTKNLKGFLRKMYKEGLINPFSTRDFKNVINIMKTIYEKSSKSIYENLQPVFYKLVKVDIQGYPDEEVLNEIKKYIDKILEE